MSTSSPSAGLTSASSDSTSAHLSGSQVQVQADAPLLHSESPIGVFDSGIGGLSILRALRQELPHENFIYFADSGYAPYGERGDDFLIKRTLAIASHLIQQHAIKALVVACNTATAAAIDVLRQNYPGLAIVGVEPAIKPAIALSRTKRIGVTATRSTLASHKFHRLLDSLSGQAEFILQPCPGLALALERSVEIPQDHSEGHQALSQVAIAALIERHLRDMGPFGREEGQIDTLVLGCTHYPFAQREFQAQTGPLVQLLETGAPVARQTRRLLENQGLLRPARAQAGELALFCTGNAAALRQAVVGWLNIPTAKAAAQAIVV